LTSWCDTPVVRLTDAEILRGFNWRPGDEEAGPLDLKILLGRARRPRAPRIVTEAELWPASLPRLPALDVAKTDLMHGCWAGPAVYGHDIEVPSISPFASQRNHDAALLMTPDWKRSGETYRLRLQGLWAELLERPATARPAWRGCGTCARKWAAGPVAGKAPDEPLR